jgi:hypothetical protein
MQTDCELPQSRPMEPIVSLGEYKQFVYSYREELHLARLQCEIIAMLMYDNQEPLFKWVLVTIVHPLVTVTVTVEGD